MKCKKVKRVLSPYLDCALSPEESNAVKRHLESCSACQEYASELEAMWKVLDVLPSMPENPYFVQRVLSRIEEKESEQFSFVHRLEHFLVPVATGFALLLGIWIGYLAGGNGERLGNENGNSTLVASTEYLETFSPLPSASLGEVYLSLNTELGEEGTP